MKIGRLASIYDGLANLVFGTKWKAIQLNASADLNEHGRVLILGGGTGKILETLTGTKITFVELSTRMIEKAQKRNYINKVKWVNTDFLLWNTDQKYDGVYCPFFLDVFPEDELSLVIRKIKSCMATDARLYVLDFQRGNWFQRVLTELMILFFRIFSGLKANKLLNIHSILEHGGFQLEKEELYNGEWIFYRVFKLSH